MKTQTENQPIQISKASSNGSILPTPLKTHTNQSKKVIEITISQEKNLKNQKSLKKSTHSKRKLNKFTKLSLNSKVQAKDM